MTKRVILSVPENLTFDQLTDIQQSAISVVFGQYVNPMPGTKAYNGYQVVDALTSDNFDPALMPEYDLDWQILAIWHDKEVIQAIDEDEFNNYLPDDVEYDANGNILSTTPPTFHFPHNWAGWPEIV